MILQKINVPIVVCLIFITCTFASLDKTVTDVEKSSLKPHELVDMISKDLLNSLAPETKNKKQPGSDRSSTTGKIDLSAIEKRKVWSRWSKWGACSVSCGRGFIIRKRVCVAGRCAPGELEEQRRMCCRSPCSVTSLQNHYYDMIE